jgi:hypothetical protein
MKDKDVTYLHRPLPVSALPFLERNAFLDFLSSRAAVSSEGENLLLRTPGQTLLAHPGDWLVSHSDGTFSVLDDAAFKAQYKPLKTTPATAKTTTKKK